MQNLKEFLANALAVLYFLTVMWWVLLLLILVPFGLMIDIYRTRSLGFAIPNVGIEFIGLFGLFIGLSLLVPAFRKLYYKLPWMFPFVKILYVNVVIMSIAAALLNYGYAIQDQTRHTLFFVLMIVQIVISRLLMCLYFSKRKVQYIGGDTLEVTTEALKEELPVKEIQKLSHTLNPNSIKAPDFAEADWKDAYQLINIYRRKMLETDPDGDKFAVADTINEKKLSNFIHEFNKKVSRSAGFELKKSDVIAYSDGTALGKGDAGIALLRDGVCGITPGKRGYWSFTDMTEEPVFDKGIFLRSLVLFIHEKVKLQLLGKTQAQRYFCQMVRDFYEISKQKERI